MHKDDLRAGKGNRFSARTVFRRQNLMSLNVKIRRLKAVPVLEEFKKYNVVDP